ncbi:MAG: MCE family protein [Elusimicrobia bacterium]|nr:MCE family protein [Elusimicrobiota bacterium]
MNQETKVGLFLIVAISAILVSILLLGNVKLFKRSSRYYVFFNNVEALPAKAAVKIAGVEIGSVRRVQLVEGRARVAIDVDPHIPIYKNARAKVGSTGIIGTKFVEVAPGSPDQPRLESGSSIEGEESSGLNQIADKISKLFERSDKYGDAIENLQESISNIRNVTRSLNIAMGNHSAELEQIVMNIRDLTENTKRFTADLQDITGDKKEDIKVAIEKFKGVGEKLDAILAKISEGKGAIGALVSDEKTGQEVKEAVTSIKDTAASAKKVMGRFTMINVYWDYRYRYDFRDDEGRSDLALRFVPRPGKFYGIGVTNIGEPPPEEKHVAYERKNRITAVLGQDYGPFTGYGGAIRSEGGVGLNFRPFWMLPKLNRRFELTAEASDFNRDRIVLNKRLKGAALDVGAHMSLTPWLWVGARWEDVLQRSAFMAYTNVVFRDEDLAYFFGFASLAK